MIRHFKFEALLALFLLVGSSLIYASSKNKNTNENNEHITKGSFDNVLETTSTQEENAGGIEYTNKIYKDNIKSVQLYPPGDPLSYPVVYLNDGRQLELHFDDLDKSYKTYAYDLIHCNANWEPSGLVVQEYLSGFFNSFIEDYQYSFNTLYPYIHYKLKFPNEEISFTKSGNYIIQVYVNNNKEDLILTRRFYVVDQKISIQSSVKMATLAKHRDYKQEVDFILNLNSYPVIDPYADLKVVISQNRRMDNAITNLKPLFVRTPELVYNYERENLFDGNNEFRFFDTKDLRYQAINVDGIQIIDGKTHVYLLTEEPRSYKQYFFQNDINGLRLIKRDDSRDANREADYIKTYFALKTDKKYEGGDLYVFGQLSEWQFQEEFKMEYVEVEGEYRCTALLKQGYYNYAYVFVPDGESKGDMSLVEGTHSATENDYFFLVYHRQQGEIYDRLVGFSKISTKDQN